MPQILPCVKCGRLPEWNVVAPVGLVVLHYLRCPHYLLCAPHETSSALHKKSEVIADWNAVQRRAALTVAARAAQDVVRRRGDDDAYYGPWG
jgi:hypothetical protein